MGLMSLAPRDSRPGIGFWGVKASAASGTLAHAVNAGLKSSGMIKAAFSCNAAFLGFGLRV